jgi:Zn ribbon nucleic-acid-binding protein
MSPDDYEAPTIACPNCGDKNPIVHENSDGTYEIEKCYKCGYQRERKEGEE